MTHVAVFSDLHLHPFEQFARIDPETGINSRLLDGFSVLRQIKTYCLKHNIQYVLNGGDLLHKGLSVSPDLLELLIKALSEFRDDNIRFISIVGQHDFQRRDGSYNLPKSLWGIVRVLNNPGEWTEIDDTRIIGCSFRYGLDAQKEALKECKKSLGKGKNIFLGHFLLKEILEQNAAPFDTSPYISVNDLPKVDYTLLGDYHFHASLKGKNVTSIGAPNHHQFGDKNRPIGGFLDFDLDTMTFKRIEVDAPMFVEVPAGEKFPNGHNPKNFYKVRVKDQKQEDRIRGNISEDFSCTFEPIVEEEEATEEETPRLAVDFSTDPSNVVREYTTYMGKGERYLQKGLEFLG